MEFDFFARKVVSVVRGVYGGGVESAGVNKNFEGTNVPNSLVEGRVRASLRFVGDERPDVGQDSGSRFGGGGG